MEYIDSHTHITNDDFNIDEFLPEIISAKEAGLNKIMLVYTIDEELKTLDRLKGDPIFDFAYGIYPNDDETIKEERFKHLREVLDSYNFKALGEIGLDYHWYPNNREIQKEYFRRQIEIANEYDLPIIVHTRDSIQDAFDILKATPCKRKGVIHCYSGSLEMAKEFIKLGYYISFSGSLTFKNNKYGVETAANIDINYLLCETDAPYLTPVPNRGKPNKTEYVKYVYEFISKLRGIEIEELKQIISDNYCRLFGK